MTTIYFVRHAEPIHSYNDDRTRPLTVDGICDCKLVLDTLKSKRIDKFYCSPYKRSADTIADTANYFGSEIIFDERLREREKGINGNAYGMYEKRWADHDYHEEGGESISMVQKRNVSALMDILRDNKDKNVVIGTHGTALSSIINYYNSDFGCDDFLRIIDWMPYIVEMKFDNQKLISINELAHISKPFNGEERADIKN